jgi:hypothetical protein
MVRHLWLKTDDLLKQVHDVALGLVATEGAERALSSDLVAVACPGRVLPKLTAAEQVMQTLLGGSPPSPAGSATPARISVACSAICLFGPTTTSDGPARRRSDRHCGAWPAPL